MRRWLALFTVLALASAQGTALSEEAGGLDLVLVVDRSGSMAGHDVEPLIGLTADMLARNAQANGVTHRIGMVSFASTPRVDASLQPIGPRFRNSLRSRMTKTGGNTDVLAAFEAAARLFDAQPSRRRAILLITDGLPSVPGMKLPEYERAMTQFAANHFSDTVIHVVLLPHRGAQHEELWRTLSGNHVQEIAGPAAFHQVIANVVGTRAQESRKEAMAQTIVLPPYLDSVVFDVFHGSRGGEVAVFAPGASRALQPNTKGVDAVRLSEAMTSIVVREPVPGVWTFRKSHADGTARVFSQEFFPRGILISPEPVRPLPQYARSEIAYRIVDRHGRPLTELPAYPLSLDMRLVGPDGRAVSLSMQRRPQFGATVFGGANAIACDAVGRYWTEVRVSTVDAERRPVNVFHDRWSGFSVDDSLPAECRGSIEAVERLRIECRDGRMPPAELFRASMSRDGRPVEARVRLQPRGAGIYEGMLDGADALGTYQLHVATPAAIRLVPRELEFVRRRHWPFRGSIAVLAIASVAVVIAVRKKRPTFPGRLRPL